MTIGDHIIVVLFFFGPAILALVILLLAGFLAPTRGSLITFGVIAALLIGLQYVLSLVLTGVGEAWSGDQAPDPFPVLKLAGGGLAMSLYFALGLFRLRRKKTADSSTKLTRLNSENS